MSFARSPRRLTLVISSLNAGGAERVMSILANAWVERGDIVRIVVQFGSPGSQPFYRLNEAVQVERLDFDSISERAAPKMGKLQQLRAMRRAILDSRPDVVLSFMDTVNVRAMLSTMGTRVPVVVTERCDPSVRPLSPVWERLRRWTYPRASVVVAQSESALAYFPESIQRSGRAVPNPVMPIPANPGIVDRSPQDRKTLMALGRLHDVKGFDRLIAAFGPLVQHHRDWVLNIWGEGPKRPALEAQIEATGLRDRVFLRGETSEPHKHLRAADLFVMTSRTEGFPMALGEAMATGLPVVSFDCPSGPRQLIRHNVDGWLVQNGDVPALTNALSQLMSDSALRGRLAARATEVTDRFSLPKILALWDEVFETAIVRGRR